MACDSNWCNFCTLFNCQYKDYPAHSPTHPIFGMCLTSGTKVSWDAHTVNIYVPGGVMNYFGTWPGDETDDELIALLKESD